MEASMPKKRPYVFMHERLLGVFEAVMVGNLFPRHYLERRVAFPDGEIERAAAEARRILHQSFLVSEGYRCGKCGKILPHVDSAAIRLHVRAHEFLADLAEYRKAENV